jgi:hypothetical protein
MNEIIFQQHFQNLDQIQVFESSSSLRQESDNIQNAGFIVRVDEDVKFFVKGNLLVERLGELYGAGDNLKGAVNRFAEFEFSKAIQEVPQAFIRIMELPNNATLETISHREDSVFKTGEGWVLNHESLVGLLTERLIYYCANEDEPHANYGTSSDECWECGREIIR